MVSPCLLILFVFWLSLVDVGWFLVAAARSPMLLFDSSVFRVVCLPMFVDIGCLLVDFVGFLLIAFVEVGLCFVAAGCFPIFFVSFDLKPFWVDVCCFCLSPNQCLLMCVDIGWTFVGGAASPFLFLLVVLHSFEFNRFRVGVC